MTEPLHNKWYIVRVGDLTTLQVLAPSKQAAVEGVLRTPSIQKMLERICVVRLADGEATMGGKKDD